MTLETVRVNWIVKGEFDCPHCEHTHDFMDIDEFWVWSGPGENKEKFFQPLKFVCEECGKEFEINVSDY